MSWWRVAQCFLWTVCMLVFVGMAISNASQGMDCRGECIMAILFLILAEIAKFPERW